MGGSSKTTTTNENQQASTVPQTPTYASDPIKNYYSGVSNYQQADPYSFVTPTNSIQQSAYQNASGLFGASPLYGQAASATQGVMNAAPQTYTANQTYAGLSPLGQASTSNVTNATAANAGQAQGVNLNGYNTANLGPAAQAGPVSLDPNATQAQAQSLLTNLQAYQNPYTDQVVNSTLSNMDHQSGVDQAALEAQGAKAGAFGGSRFGIAQSNLMGDQERARAAQEAGLRSSAFNTAAGLSQSDAALRQQVNLANAGAQNQRTEMGAQLNTQNNQFNAGQSNQYGLAKFDAQNTANQFGANAQNTGALANQNANNQFALTNSGYNQQANLANASAANQNSQFNAGQQNQFALTGAQLANQNNQFNAGIANAGSQFNANTMNQAQQQELARQLQSAGLLSDIGTAYGNNYRSDVGTQLDLGNSMYNLQNIANNAPLTQLQNVGNLLNPGLIDSVSGKTVTGTNSGVSQEQTSGGLFNSLLNAAATVGGAAIMHSDRRVKLDIVRLGEDPDGLGAYRFRYAWDRPEAVRYGVMADEVERLRPYALGPVVDGIRTVDYGRLEAAYGQ